MDMSANLLMDGDVHGGYGYVGRNAECDMILEIGDETEMVAANILFIKRDSIQIRQLKQPA